MSGNGTASIGQSDLRAVRLELGLSQEKLARLADCSTKMVALLEGGYSPSGSAVLRRISETLARQGEPLNDHDPAANGAVEEEDDRGVRDRH